MTERKENKMNEEEKKIVFLTDEEAKAALAADAEGEGQDELWARYNETSRGKD